jgi:UDP-glucose 4-epimerase
LAKSSLKKLEKSTYNVFNLGFDNGNSLPQVIEFLEQTNEHNLNHQVASF